jgi:hypothetical protein
LFGLHAYRWRLSHVVLSIETIHVNVSHIHIIPSSSIRYDFFHFSYHRYIVMLTIWCIHRSVFSYKSSKPRLADNHCKHRISLSKCDESIDRLESSWKSVLVPLPTVAQKEYKWTEKDCRRIMRFDDRCKRIPFDCTQFWLLNIRINMC